MHSVEGIDVNPELMLDSRPHDHHNYSQSWNTVARPQKVGMKWEDFLPMSNFVM